MFRDVLAVKNPCASYCRKIDGKEYILFNFRFGTCPERFGVLFDLS